MKVKRLINLLKNLPEDYDVAITNNSMFIDGTYRATGIEVDHRAKQVEVITDFEYQWNGENWKK